MWGDLTQRDAWRQGKEEERTCRLQGTGARKRLEMEIPPK